MSKKNSSSVRIIGGRHRGRRLAFTDTTGEVRPSSDRLRETLFNWLQFQLHGAKVLDAFAGTGALGAEAVSRGASHATFIDVSAQRCEQLTLSLPPVLGGQHTIVRGDAVNWLQQHTPTEPFHLVFVDPPYHLNLQEPFCHALQQYAWLADSALIYVESDHRHPEPKVPSQWQLEKTATMGQIRAQLYRCVS